MDSTINEYRERRHLLIWPVPIPSNVQALFTVVFMDIMGLITYVSMVFSRTEKFYFTTHLDYFEDLKNDPIYEFPSVVHIYVICDNFRDAKLAKHRFPNEPEKVQFGTIYDLLESLGKTELDTALVSSNLIDRSTISVIISLIEASISAKRSDMSISHAHIQKESASTTLYGFPVRNIDDFIPCYVCPSCKLVYQQAYLLECKHQQCGICANIQKGCSTCFKDVSRDKIMVNQNLQIQMQDILTHCSNCDWKQPLKNYEVHFKQNHYELISHFIYTQQLDERISHPQYLTEEDQVAYISNSSASDSDTTRTSLNSTYIWQISDVRDIKNYAAFNEQKSIYSTPFYLSPYGYKMCLQLFLNRDDRTRSTHISVGLLMKQGVHDENLRWPFEYKVTFTLVNQLQPNHSQSQSFWTDSTSICFRRPIADMNLPFGISKCFSLDVCEEIEEHFIHNNTMFVKVTVDFLARKPEIPYKNNAGELMSNTEQDGVTDDGIFAKICLSDNSNSNQRSN